MGSPQVFLGAWLMEGTHQCENGSSEGRRPESTGIRQWKHSFPCTTAMEGNLHALKNRILCRQVLPCWGLDDLNDWIDKNRRNSEQPMVNTIQRHEMIPWNIDLFDVHSNIAPLQQEQQDRKRRRRRRRNGDGEGERDFLWILPTAVWIALLCKTPHQNRMQLF